MISPKIVTLFLFLGLLGVLWFGFPTKPSKLLDSEQERRLNLQSTQASILITEAIGQLSSSTRTQIQLLEAQIAGSSEDSVRVALLKDLASLWYGEGHIAIAGSYAEQVAHIIGDAQAWSIAGTTYGMGIKTAGSEKERKYCIDKALLSLENAISLDPENIAFQLNRAIILAEHPPSDNPMQGVLMLLDLNKNNPQNVSVINNIAKFALQTGQLDKAEQRLLTADSLSPNNKMTNCLFAQLYNAKGDKVKADWYRTKCEI